MTRPYRVEVAARREVAPCDPNQLWVEHQIRWCDGGKKGPGWHKYKDTGAAKITVKLTQKECPLCGSTFHDQATGSPTRRHPRPAAWLEVDDKKARDESGKADAAVRLLQAASAEQRASEDS